MNWPIRWRANELAQRARCAASRHLQFIPLRTSHAALLTAWLCAWTSNAPGEDVGPEVDPWGAPLSAQALDATSQSGTNSTAVAATPPPSSTDSVPTASTPPVAASVVAPSEPTPFMMAPPAVTVTTDGRERSVVLAIPLEPDHAAPELSPAVLYVSGPAQLPGPFEFNAAVDKDLPEPVIAFEPPATRADEISVAALGAIEHIARDTAPLAYPARLEDVPMPAALESAARLETAASNAAAAEHPAQAAVTAPALVTTQQNVLPLLPGLLAQQSRIESVSATSQRGAVSTEPQLLAKVDIGQRMPGPPLAPAALAQISAFDASRTVQRFEVSGSTALSRPIIDDALKAFLGVDRTDTHLQAARDALQRAHDVNGRRVKVVLPEQRERDGVARLEVREIKRYSLRIAGELRYDPVLRRNVRSDVNLDHDEPLPSLTLSRKLSLK